MRPPWVALAAGLMAAVSGAGLGGLREGVGGALMGSSGASGKKKRPKNYNDDGGTMSLKKAHKRARRKKQRAKRKRRRRKKRNRRKNRRGRRGRGRVKVDAKVVGQEENPPKPQPVETPVPTGTEEPESTATPELGSDLGVTTTQGDSSMLIFKRLPEGIEPVTTPEPEPVPTPTPTAEELESARARRLALAEQEYIDLEPLEYIRHNVYWANGIDYYVLAENREDNTLSLEVINDNDSYPGGVRPAIAMTAAEEINSSFVRELRMDSTHYPNYEPVFFEELKRAHAKIYSRIADDMTGEEGEIVVTTEEIASRQIIRSIYSLMKKWWSYEAGVR